MTTASRAEIRIRNQLMLERIRAQEPQAHHEGRYALRIMTVAGRSSGNPRAVPIALVQFDGAHYVCSPDRSRDWVRNLLKAGRCVVENDDRSVRDACLVEDIVGATAVSRYLSLLPRVSDEWPITGSTPPEQVLPYMRQIAVFRLDPAV